VKLIRTAMLAAAAVWAGRKLLARREGAHGGRGGPDDQPVATGGDGFQTEPPVAGPGGD
jgi:hypothetical protein